MAKKDEEKKVEEVEVEKPRQNPFENVPPHYLIGGAVVAFLGVQRWLNRADPSDHSGLLIVGFAIVVLYLISRYVEPDYGPLTPMEAEKAVAVEINRKLNWQQWPEGTKLSLMPINNAQHRDGKGHHYRIGVEVDMPYSNHPEYYQADVMMEGKERGNVSLVRSVGIPTGREIINERSIIPPLLKMSRKEPLIFDMLRKFGRF